MSLVTYVQMMYIFKNVMLLWIIGLCWASQETWQ